jgi:hypothetical protein
MRQVLRSSRGHGERCPSDGEQRRELREAELELAEQRRTGVAGAGRGWCRAALPACRRG